MRRFSLPTAGPGRTRVATEIGASQIAASVYVLDDGETGAPYHFHHGIEEWVIALSGSPRVRTPAGERTLAAGDSACFPVGPGGLHQVIGPGAVLIVSDVRDLDVAELPDSGEIVVRPPGARVKGTTAEIATGGPERPVVNLHAFPLDDDPDQPAGFHQRAARVGPALGGERLGASIYELAPGEANAPYHYEGVEEEWLLVLSGAPALRDPDGEHPLETGDVVGFAIGPDGAHKISNRSDTVARILLLSTMPANELSICVYPDSEKVSVWPWPAKRLRITESVSYWDGER
jgi:uncharacterized cupin superfamily protein